MSLIDAQRRFLATIVAGAAQSSSVPATRKDAGVRIYAKAYRLRLAEAMGETFEATRLWMGDEEFHVAIERYIGSRRSRSWTLAEYGCGFADLLKVLYPNNPDFADLAALDWALRRAFDGPDARPAALEDLKTADWDAGVLRFVPTLRLVPLRTNAPAIRTALTAGIKPPASARLARPAAACVWRKGLSPFYRTIEGRELEALAAARSGIQFGQICARLSKNQDSAAAAGEIGAILAQWLQDDMIAAVETFTSGPKRVVVEMQAAR